MYVGHGAIALIAKAKRPTLALALLVPVAWGPDWVEAAFAHFGHRNRMLSHSLVAVGIGATVVALAYYLATRARADAAALWLTYASHWPADYITGQKPTWPGGPTVGLFLYRRPTDDFVLESTLVIVATAIYARSLPPAGKRRGMILWMPVGLLALQIVFEYFNGRLDWSV